VQARQRVGLTPGSPLLLAAWYNYANRITLRKISPMFKSLERYFECLCAQSRETMSTAARAELRRERRKVAERLARWRNEEHQ
jgi:hypothetical protein